MNTVPKSYYDEIARVVGVPRDKVKKIAHMLAYSGDGGTGHLSYTQKYILGALAVADGIPGAPQRHAEMSQEGARLLQKNPKLWRSATETLREDGAVLESLGLMIKEPASERRWITDAGLRAVGLTR